MPNGFTRQEVIKMTGVNSGRLSYLDQTGVVVPEKFGNPQHPKVFYSWEKVLQIKVIDRLRERLSLQEIRNILKFLEQRNYQPSLFQCNLVFVGDRLYLIEDWEEFGHMILEASGKNKGQLVVQEIGAIGEVIAELQAMKDEVLDFEKRAKGTPLEVSTK
jgi:DNA-binding transcriptional MerR regulator